MRLFACFLLSVCLLSTVSAHADRDIVYAARYYTPPGSHRTSHFHLYRINPDGTGRTQLTYGNQDDTDPHWSPDGRKVVFLRDDKMVYLIDADGRRLLQLASWGDGTFVDDPRWLPDGNTVAFVHDHDTPQGSQSALWLVDATKRHARRFLDVTDYGVSPAERYLVSPDGILLFVQGQDGGKIISRSTGAIHYVPGPFDEPAWLDDQELIGHDDETPLTLYVFGLTNNSKVSLIMRPPQPDPWGQDLATGYGWLQYSPRPDTIVYALNEHDSTVGAQAAFFLVSLADGATRFLAQGQFIAWSPHGRRFCTAPGRDTWTYKERKWDRTYRTVWAAPLQTGVPGGKLKTVTPDLVWVTGADWRKRQQ